MTDTLIKVENVSKKFCRSLKKSLWYGMQDLGNELIGRQHGGNGGLRPEEFWAVKEVSLVVKRGECIGLIGHNGAGKTTLLRMLNGLIKPDSGRIEMRGRVGALIALGAGFNPILTGRENIYVNATVLGLGKREIEKRLDEIIEFSGLADFIDSPVQHYSSGMYVRLGFAIAVHVHPDILLVDEALAVGDLAFVVKCLNKIAELRRNGTGVVFVSHSELQIREAAQRCIVMSKAKLLFDGGNDQAFLHYDQSRELSDAPDHSDMGFVHDGPIQMGQCIVNPPASRSMATSGESLHITLQCDSAINASGTNLELRFWNTLGQLVTSINSAGQNCTIDLVEGRNIIKIDIPFLALVPGRYRLAGGIWRQGEILGWARDLTHFDIAPPLSMKVSEGLFITPATFSVLHTS